MKIKIAPGRSKLFALNIRDGINGLLLAALASVLFFAQECLEKEEIVLDWKGIGMAAVSGIVGYLIKNFFTTGDPQKPEANDQKVGLN